MEPKIEVHVIQENGVYFDEDVRRLLRIKQHTLVREVRAGNLAYCRRGKTRVFLGSQLLAWLRAGEVRKAEPTGSA